MKGNPQSLRNWGDMKGLISTVPSTENNYQSLQLLYLILKILELPCYWPPICTVFASTESLARKLLNITQDKT